MLKRIAKWIYSNTIKDVVFTIVLTAFLLVLLNYFLATIGLVNETDTYKGITLSMWHTIWAIAENGILLTFVIIASIHTVDILKYISTYIFIPVISLKLIYQISCFTGKKVLPAETWNSLWSKLTIVTDWILAILILSSIALCLYKFTKREKIYT